MAAARLDPVPFEVSRREGALRGEEMGEGPAVALAHGVTATRRYVVHGSKALARAGYRQLSYDARAHGESDPAPEGEGYGYGELARDLRSVLDDRDTGPVVLCGDSMGSHTVAALALADPRGVAGVVLTRPATLGLPPDQESLAHWDRLARGLEEGGADGFMRAYEQDLSASPDYAETVLRFTRERMSLHRNPRALAEAVRQVPRSIPFDGMAELESLRVPALVVGSRDEADPGHPLAVAEAWAEAIPDARLVVEGEGESPLAWQGGKLSREIAAFCETPEVAARHRP